MEESHLIFKPHPDDVVGGPAQGSHDRDLGLGGLTRDRRLCRSIICSSASSGTLAQGKPHQRQDYNSLEN
jgi:hypothetical protein